MIKAAILLFLELKRPHTKRSYIIALKEFCYFIKSKWEDENNDQALERATPDQCMRYIASIKNRELSENTLRQRFSALRAIYRHLERLALVNKNPFDSIIGMLAKRQRHQVRPTAYIDAEKIDKLLDAPDPKSKTGIRDRALLAILFGGGLRRSEALALNLADVALSAKGNLYLKLRHTKAGQIQEQALPEWAANRFSDLVIQRKRDGATEQDPLFVMYYLDGKPRSRLAEKTIYLIFTRYAAALGIKAAPHSARASAATKLLLDGFAEKDVQRFLRHSTSKMVEAYDKRARTVDESAALNLFFKT